MASRRKRELFLPMAVACLLAGPAIADGGGKPIDAVTAGGDKVMLYPNGRWEYVDRGKADQAKKIADTYPENQARPPEAQGGLFGIGRTLLPGDKDYNRGTLNPKQR